MYHHRSLIAKYSHTAEQLTVGSGRRLAFDTNKRNDIYTETLYTSNMCSNTLHVSEEYK